MSKKHNDLTPEQLRQLLKEDFNAHVDKRKDLIPQICIVMGVDDKTHSPYIDWCGNCIFASDIKFEGLYGMLVNLFFGHLDNLNAAVEADIKPCVVN